MGSPDQPPERHPSGEQPARPGESSTEHGRTGQFRPDYSSPGNQQPHYPPGYPYPGYPQSAPQGYPPPSYPQGYPQPGYPRPGYPQQPSYQWSEHPPQGYQQGSPWPGPGDPTAVIGPRIGQYILDALLVGVPVWIVYGLGFALIGSSVPTDPTDDEVGTATGLVLGLVLLAVLLAFGLSWLSQAWWPRRHAGQTPAMGWLKLRIVDERGGVPSVGALTLRWMMLIVDGFFFGVVGLVVMASSPGHQRIGDMVAKTYVVRAG